MGSELRLHCVWLAVAFILELPSVLGITQKAERILTKAFFFKSLHKDMLIDFREKGRDGEKERNIDVREKLLSVASCTHPDWDQTRNLSMFSGQESDL